MADKPKKPKVSQSDVPRHTLPDSLRVARAINDEFGGRATSPMNIAAALEISPSSSTYRTLTGAAMAYGLTNAAYNSSLVGLTDLGKRVVAPLEEGDDRRALVEAVLKPRVVREFLKRYDGSRLPSDNIALNVIKDLGVAAEAAERVRVIIIRSADAAGVLREIKDKTFVDLSALGPSGGEAQTVVRARDAEERPGVEEEPASAETASPSLPEELEGPSPNERRVFVSHGRNREMVEKLKELLTFGDFEPVVSVERESVSKPVPEKVLDDMRECSAAIIHVDSERQVLEPDGNRRNVLNENVLIEIGAAMALYKRRFILLVREGVDLPSNLQGLYEVRYSGEDLNYEATMKLLRALNAFKSPSS